MNAAHAVHAPSSAKRWSKCPGSAQAIAAIDDYYEPEEEGEAATEGTQAHDEIDKMFKPLGSRSGEADLVDISDFHNLVTPAPLDHPAAYGLRLVYDAVKKIIEQYGKVAMWVEQRVHLTQAIWGRCDIAIWVPSHRLLIILDYKNGMRAVDAEDNDQTGIYAAGTIKTQGIDPLHIQHCIVQPNDWRHFVPRVKWWTEGRAALDLRTIEWITAVGQTFLKAGEHCRDCPLFGTCDPSVDLLTQFGAVIAGLVNPANVRPEQVAMFFSLQKPIEDQIKAFKKAWSDAATKGNKAPAGMKFVAEEGRRKWTNEQEAWKRLGYPDAPEWMKLPTPSQAEELGIKVDDIASKGKPFKVLAPESDKRKPWTGPEAGKMFAAVDLTAIGK
jgi:hypothetical protein